MIDQWHVKRGWNGIGYHFVILIGGQTVEGRSIERVGAHVEGSNANSIGICMVGTDKFDTKQWRSLAALVRRLQADYPAADVLGHRDYSPDKNGDGLIQPWEWTKTCPGFDVQDWLLAGMEPLFANVYNP